MALRSQFTEKKLALFIVSNDSLYLRELAVQSKKFKEKIFIPEKAQKTRENFSVEISKKSLDFNSAYASIPNFFILVIYVTNSWEWASYIFEKCFISYLFGLPIILCDFKHLGALAFHTLIIRILLTK